MKPWTPDPLMRRQARPVALQKTPVDMRPTISSAAGRMHSHRARLLSTGRAPLTAGLCLSIDEVASNGGADGGNIKYSDMNKNSSGHGKDDGDPRTARQTKQ